MGKALGNQPGILYQAVVRVSHDNRRRPKKKCSCLAGELAILKVYQDPTWGNKQDIVYTPIFQETAQCGMTMFYTGVNPTGIPAARLANHEEQISTEN